LYADIEIMKELASQLFATRILSSYGGSGGTILKNVLDTIHKLFIYVDPSLLQGKLIIFKLLEGDDCQIDRSQAKHFRNARYLAQHVSTMSNLGTSVVQICANGEILFFHNIECDLSQLYGEAIVYIYHDNKDIFMIRENECIVPNPNPSYASIFATPTFSDLRAALEDYRLRAVRTSHCTIFATAWKKGDPGRMFFQNAPESTIRKSLVHFLDVTFGGNAEVRPEQTVDATHPVDIKVTWMFTNKLALIEIKWLGKSMNEKGSITATYSESRALEGAKQLADYLDANYNEVPMHQTRGYLVVIDGRREGLRRSSKTIKKSDGYWYLDKEIVYDPEYHVIRGDFEEPMRMFAEPVCR